MEPPLRRLLVGWWAGVLLSLVLVGYGEWSRWESFESEDAVDRVFDMLFSFNIDSTPYAILLLALPICWLARRDVFERTPRWIHSIQKLLAETPGSAERGARLRAGMLALLVGITAAFSVGRIAKHDLDDDPKRVLSFGDLPPAFHDEYSYIFQARTFEAGRWNFPSHDELPRVFDQMHVLNEGHFASRYFPGTGLWIAVFGDEPNRYLGHWIATVFACVSVFGIGRELACNGVGLLAGMLAAVSPGIGLFGNLLLAHQPTLAALGLFIYAFLKLQRCLHVETHGVAGVERSEPPNETTIRGPLVMSLLSGLGLAFAMLCRPMTAAGIGLPFGVWLSIWLFRTGRHHRKLALAIVAGFALPLIAAFGTLMTQNQAITGDPFRSPYQVYTDLFTPSHMYGFNNVERAKPMQTDRVLKHYDDWAENLDASLAASNVGYRLLASCQWTLGLVPLLIAACVVLTGTYRQLDSRWWLIVGAVGSLHLLHIPYWFDGIMHWHYVFESSVLWCLLAAGATILLFHLFRRLGRPWMPVWWSAVLLAAVTVNHTSMTPFWGLSRLDAGISELSFARTRFQEFHRVVQAGVDQSPALVLIRHNPADRHIDYVSNSPDLSGPILFGRISADSQQEAAETIRAVTIAFPDRSVYLAIAPAQIGQPWQFRRLK